MNKKKSPPIDLQPTSSTEIANTVGINPDRAVAILDACERKGLKLDRLILKVNEALEACTITIDKYGEEHSYPDHATRLKAVMLGGELRGDLKRGGGVNVAVGVSVQVSEKERELLDAYRRE